MTQTLSLSCDPEEVTDLEIADFVIDSVSVEFFNENLVTVVRSPVKHQQHNER